MNNFEQHIKDQMQNFAPTPPPAAWAGVSSGMGSTTAAKVGAKLLMKWVAGVLITAGVVTTAVIIYNNSQSNLVQSNPIAQTTQQATNNNTDNKVETNTINSSTANQINSENKNKSGKQNEVLQHDVQPMDITPIPMDIAKGNEISGIGAISNSPSNISNPQPKKYNTIAISAPAKIDLSDNTLCPEQVLIATVQNCQGCSINWGDGESDQVNTSELKHSYLKEGKYIISVNGVNKTITVKKPSFNVETSLLNSTTVIYKITNPDNLELNVQFADGRSEVVTKKEIKHSFSDGELNAKFSTNSYCKVSKDVPMKLDIVQPLIPNTFTPNSDGNNDKYEIDFKGMALKFYHIEIIDIKGQTVFESFSPTEGWDGTYKNIPMPEASYTMQLIYQFEQFAQPEKPVKIAIMLKK